ncbi:predicted protein [Postia placenta Mad-698-R]|nr:predicted protein [Postia placenta Mad-698-R]
MPNAEMKSNIWPLRTGSRRRRHAASVIVAPATARPLSSACGSRTPRPARGLLLRQGVHPGQDKENARRGIYHKEAHRLGLEQDDLDALDLDDESRGIIRVIRKERAHIARRRALLHDMDLDLQKMEKVALAKGGIGFVRGAVDDD